MGIAILIRTVSIGVFDQKHTHTHKHPHTQIGTHIKRTHVPILTDARTHAHTYCMHIHAHALTVSHARILPYTHARVPSPFRQYWLGPTLLNVAFDSMAVWVKLGPIGCLSRLSTCTLAGSRPTAVHVILFCG